MKNFRLIIWAIVIGLGAYMALEVTSPKNRAVISTGSGIGGPFELTAHTGQKYSSHMAKGQYQLIYFGYSFCPDVCPMELQKITEALTTLDEGGTDITKIQPLFISVDPARDTVENLTTYMSLFHPSLIGLTGSEAEIAAVAKQFRIYYKKQIVEDMDGYLMDHLNIIILMNPDGGYDRIFSAKDGPDALVAALKARIEGM